MSEILNCNDERIEELTTEQISLFGASELIKPLETSEILLGKLALNCTEVPSQYRNLSAKFKDDPKTDTLSVTVDRSTLRDLFDEFSEPARVSQDDIIRMYVGTGLANLLMFSSFAGPARTSRMTKFAEALSEPQGLYDRTMGSKIFDNADADQTAVALASDGHTQTANVNVVRLSTGMFIEAQPKPSAIRKTVEAAFQGELAALFDGKQNFIQTSTRFNITHDEAEAMHTNNVEIMMGLSFPMKKSEVKKLLKILS